ncbi:MAG: hypothetical protein LQ349_001720 [Xanthoria aureola]|nr:MAG: hypothetical protein LQ349_001720 [Xanthoria aureola]
MVASDLRSFNKRRKQQTEAIDPSSPMVGSSEDFALTFNPPQPIPIPLQTPARLFSDAELDNMSINRANTRAAAALQKLDEAHQSFADQAKEARLSSQMEYDKLSKKSLSENRRLAEDLATCRQKLAKVAPEWRTDSAAANNVTRSEVTRTGIPQPSLIEKLQQELRTVKEDAKRVDDANNLLDKEAAKMRLDGRDAHSMIHEVKTLHDKLTTKIDRLASQDLQDLTNKEVKKFIMDVKAEDQEFSIKVRQVEDFLSKPNHLTFGATNGPPDLLANGSVAGGPS